jgi:23S rRNA pseudouridine1911/1915/1917 synthase
MMQELDVLYHSGAVWVLNKPAGLLTQGPPGIDSLELRLRRSIQWAEGKTGNIYLGVPHRLDRPVSGAITMVRNVRAAQRISLQIQQRTVVKKYWAVVSGELGEESGIWVDFMRKIPDEARSELVPADHPEAKQAVLSYRVLGRWDLLHWLEIELQTGRTHQIRLQAASRRLPIVGDSLYQSRLSFGIPTTDLRKQAIALHARRLIFQHPMVPETVDVTAPLNSDWDQFPEIMAKQSSKSD